MFNTEMKRPHTLQMCTLTLETNTVTVKFCTKFHELACGFLWIYSILPIYHWHNRERASARQSSMFSNYSITKQCAPIENAKLTRYTNAKAEPPRLNCVCAIKNKSSNKIYRSEYKCDQTRCDHNQNKPFFSLRRIGWIGLRLNTYKHVVSLSHVHTPFTSHIHLSLALSNAHCSCNWTRI